MNYFEFALVLIRDSFRTILKPHQYYAPFSLYVRSFIVIPELSLANTIIITNVPSHHPLLPIAIATKRKQAKLFANIVLLFQLLIRLPPPLCCEMEQSSLFTGLLS